MNNQTLPSLDFIAGFINHNASFLWVKYKNTEIPVFQLKLHPKERLVLEMIREKLSIKEKIYEYHHNKRHYILLIIRHRSTIENTIIPSFEGRLLGQTNIEFNTWKDRYFQKKIDFIYKKPG